MPASSWVEYVRILEEWRKSPDRRKEMMESCERLYKSFCEKYGNDFWENYFGGDGKVGMKSPGATMDGDQAPTETRSFGKVVAETVRGIKQDFASKGAVDPQVREQVNSDLDKIIDRHENGKSWPGRI